jgi:Cu-Zn family superoxide dismutase
MQDFEHLYHKYKKKYLESYKNKVYAICVLKTDKINGIIYFEEDKINKSTKICGNISGLNPNSKHAIHIHEYGDLTDKCNSCCAHYNPFNKDHGDRTAVIRHVGDLGNLSTDISGNTSFEFIDKLVKLRGPYSVIGRSIVIHENEDDLGLGNHEDSKTTGHAGNRIVCGIIGLRKNPDN